MKRKQHALPGLFDTAEEAAVMLAVVKKQMKADDHSVTNIMHMSDPNAAGVGR